MSEIKARQTYNPSAFLAGVGLALDNTAYRAFLHFAQYAFFLLFFFFFSQSMLKLTPLKTNSKY
jgi:hypothetical protein